MTRDQSGFRPRLGFLGVGWIGRHRMEAILATGVVDVVAIADPSPKMAAEAAQLAPAAALVGNLEELLERRLDGVVIATPSAMHAEQAIRSLERGAAVFCQKPLGRTADEVQRVADAARDANRLLGVDMSYRFTNGMRKVREVIASGELGHVYAVDLVFHNAYGPDKPWFYDRSLSGGGCLMDLGVHLVDLALWSLCNPKVAGVSSTLLAAGEMLRNTPDRVEDYALATLELETGAVVQLACSWQLQAGCDAVISAVFYGTEGGVSFRNVNGSFYDFVGERHQGTSRLILTNPPENWGGRAAAEWAVRLAAGERFDPAVQELVQVAGVLDRIYAQAGNLAAA